MQKKKSSYNAKKEKLINIKEHLKYFWSMNDVKDWMDPDPDMIKSQNVQMLTMLDLIWEIVKDEKNK